MALSMQTLFANTQGYFDNNCGIECWNECNHCDANFYASVDWLYWKTRRCDLEIAAYKGVGDLSFTVREIPSQGKALSANQSFYSGARASAGMEWCNRWGFGFEYIYFSPTESSLARSPDQTIVISMSRVPFLTNAASGFNPLDVHAKFGIKYNRCDLFFSFKHGCNPCREIHTFFGARLVWLKDTLRTTYSRDPIKEAPTLPVYKFKLLERTDLHAYGLVVGGRIFQDLCNSFGLYLKGCFGVLYGCYDQHSRTTYLPSVGTQTLPGYNMTDNSNCLVPVVDLALGLGVEGCEFYCVRWSLIAGYEFQNFFAYRDYLRPLTDLNVFVNNKSNMGFDGFFIRLGGEF